MQAPFLCLISFLERCRYLGINCILTRLATGPGEYVPMPFIKGMVNRRSGKIQQFHSRSLYISWGMVHRRLSPSFPAEMEKPKSFANVSSFTSFTHCTPSTPTPSHDAVLQLVTEPSRWSLPVHQQFGWEEFCLVWDLLLFSFCWHLSTGHVSGVTLPKSLKPSFIVLFRRSVIYWMAELGHLPGFWILPVLASVHVLSR